jgi:hypothetical protein
VVCEGGAQQHERVLTNVLKRRSDAQGAESAFASLGECR